METVGIENIFRIINGIKLKRKREWVNLDQKEDERSMKVHRQGY